MSRGGGRGGGFGGGRGECFDFLKEEVWEDETGELGLSKLEGGKGTVPQKKNLLLNALSSLFLSVSF